MGCSKKFNCLFILAGISLFTVKGYSQCSQININGLENPVFLQYDKNGRLISLSGTDEDEGARTINFEVVNGISVPVKGQKGIAWADNGDGSLIITMGEGEDEDEARNQFKINKDGKLTVWDLVRDGQFKTTSYTYDKNGDLAKMVWEGTFFSTRVTDKGELTATFNTTRPSVIMKGGPLLFLVEAGWQMLPMTNSHQITSFTYNQTIHMPETKKEIGYDKQNNSIYKTIPAKDIKNTITRNFSYTYDNAGRPASVTVSGKGVNKTFKFTYTDCN